MKRLIVLLSCAFLLGSCSDFKQKEQLRSVERLQANTNGLSSRMERSFPDTLSAMRQNMMELQLFLKSNVVLDSVDRTYAANMDAYKMTSKKIAPIHRQYVALKKAFVDEKNRLADLHSDISNGFGKRQKYDAYILKETKNVSVLKLRTTEFMEALKDMTEQYHLLHPKLSALASKLR